MDTCDALIVGKSFLTSTVFFLGSSGTSVLMLVLGLSPNMGIFPAFKISINISIPSFDPDPIHALVLVHSCFLIVQIHASLLADLNIFSGSSPGVIRNACIIMMSSSKLYLLELFCGPS